MFNNFFNFLFMLFILGFCTTIIVLVIYTSIKRKKFLKKGVPVKVKVIEVQNINRNDIAIRL